MEKTEYALRNTQNALRTSGSLNGHNLAAHFVARDTLGRPSNNGPAQGAPVPCRQPGRDPRRHADARQPHLSRFAVEAWGGDQATVLRRDPERGLHGLRASMAGTSFANANAANGLDLDDSARYAYGHAGARRSSRPRWPWLRRLIVAALSC